jgi:mannitol-1-phosphate 5-dehydrogenase
MALTGERTFVGFGFGAIQAGLFLHEAYQSGAFRRLVVAEVMPEAVAALRRSKGYFAVNIAHPYRVESVAIGPIEAEDPSDRASRARILAALVQAVEIATAVPSVEHYRSQGPESIHRLLAEAFSQREAGGPPAVVYAAENHNQAAEILREAVASEIPLAIRDRALSRVSFLNTVIGKMSGVITDPSEIRARGLDPVTRGEQRAFLVEAFNRILVSSMKFSSVDSALGGFRRGLSVFEEKPDLLPFEEAKLYGHNAAHAAAAYLASLAGLRRIAELRQLPGAMEFLRGALVEESGAALVKRHRGVDQLFTAHGYQAYAEDLLSRMTNPHLGDTTERVGRDVRRKLGWDDRLIGTIRVALSEGIAPRRFAFAAAAALACLAPELLDPTKPAGPKLKELWGEAAASAEAALVIAAVEGERGALSSWVKAGFPSLEQLVREAPGSRTS